MHSIIKDSGEGEGPGVIGYLIVGLILGIFIPAIIAQLRNDIDDDSPEVWDLLAALATVVNIGVVIAVVGVALFSGFFGNGRPTNLLSIVWGISLCMAVGSRVGPLL